MGDRLPEAKMMTIGLPVAQGEHERGPPSGRLVTQSLYRRVDAPLGCLIIFLQPPPMESPCHSLVVLRRYPLEMPLQYMPYMEHHFQALTGIRLEGLSQFTGWIKSGSYYHGVVARKGQLHLCLHLAGATPPKGPQIHPSQTQAVMQKKEETPINSHPMPGREGSMTQGACSDPPIPMETVEQGMVSLGWNRPRPVLRRNGGETDLQSIAGHCLGDGEFGLPIPSHSRILREDRRQSSSSTSMQVSSYQPVTMWLPKEWPATTPTWNRVWPRASTTRYSA